MVPELGSFALVLALCFAIIQTASSWRALVITCVIGQTVFLGTAMLCLIGCFLLNDTTVIYVREHSHVLLPVLYRIGAAWGGHEGSLLLWCLILSGWSTAFVLFADKQLSTTSRTQILRILGFLSSGFILFLFITSNPFLRDFSQAATAGNDLTPILQDPGLIFHPPMLYLGYVGFAVGFAFAISALLQRQADQHWARACQPWIILPWSFLSCGIVLGSWWAYRELGWGGWWFWDPVENASLLPWLSATALLHSLIVSEKRNNFKGWTLLLAIITFTLSLLGTFLVRSGVLVSVHAFANDPTRGLFLLAYLTVIIGSGFLLYGIRIKDFYQAPQFALLSRETFLLLNSVILLAAVFTIVIGTLYPIVLDALGLGKISVGEPYFNTVFLPIILPLLLLMGFAPHIHWHKQKKKMKLNLSFFVSLLFACLLPWIFNVPFYWLTTTGIFLGIWIIIATLQYTYNVWQPHHQLSLRHAAMVIAHIGIAIIALGVTVNKSYSSERQMRVHLGETVTLSNYQFTFANANQTQGANYRAITAAFAVQHNHDTAQTLLAEQRVYTSNQETLSKPGILVNPFRDLYLALGNGFADGSWSVRIYYKPFVRWIWCGGFLLLLGGLLSLLAYWRQREGHKYV